jgi:hypothetical protein
VSRVAVEKDSSRVRRPRGVEAFGQNQIHEVARQILHGADARQLVGVGVPSGDLSRASRASRKISSRVGTRKSQWKWKLACRRSVPGRLDRRSPR